MHIIVGTGSASHHCTYRQKTQHIASSAHIDVTIYHSCPSINAIGPAPPAGRFRNIINNNTMHVCLHALQTPQSFCKNQLLTEWPYTQLRVHHVLTQIMQSCQSSQCIIIIHHIAPSLPMTKDLPADMQATEVTTTSGWSAVHDEQLSSNIS
jgi:hypothetical protein